MDPKKMAARKAAELIRDGSSVGIGAGSTMLYLCECVKEKIESEWVLKLFTSSADTAKFLRQLHIEVLETSLTARLDIYFDGCDQIDGRLNALKSGSGIHTMEKLLASMAKKFVIIGDASKFVQRLDTKFPLVLEVLPSAIAFVHKIILSLYPDCTLTLRKSPGPEDKPVLTRNGNLLLDCWFREWPELEMIQIQCKKITGVIEISLFYQMVNEAIIANYDGIARYVKRNDQIHLLQTI